MNCTLAFDTASGIAMVRLEGVVTVPELAEAFSRLKLEPEYREGIPRLWDARHADMSELGAAEFRMIGSAAQESGLSNPGLRVAFLVSRDVDFGIGRMFQSTVAETLPAEMAIFRAYDAAMSWLREGQSSAS